MVSFRIGVPSYLPLAFGYTSVRVDPTYPTGGLVYLIYSPVPIGSNITMDGLLVAGGFFVVEDHELATDPGRIIDAAVREQGAAKVTINGSPGLYAGNQVHWWATGTHYAIVSPFSEAEMLAIANSMAS